MYEPNECVYGKDVNDNGCIWIVNSSHVLIYSEGWVRYCAIYTDMRYLLMPAQHNAQFENMKTWKQHENIFLSHIYA